ncbi:MAG: cation:proton antiporter [Nanoarchaeota archaeon]|nr:cation:proton antiporter [Nanoarchaeota archaeon]
MATAYVNQLFAFSVLFLVGVIVSFFSAKIKLSNVLPLILIGILFGYLFGFDPSLVATVGLFALILIIFESTSKFKIREIGELSPYALKLTTVFFFFNLIFLTVFANLLFGTDFSFKSFILAFVFAALMSGTSPDVVLVMFKDVKDKLIDLLSFEAIINTPLTVLFPILIAEFYMGVFQANIILKTFALGIMAGIGTGLFFGFLLLKILKGWYMKNLSPLFVIACALITYSLAESIGGNGVLAVTVLGVVYGRLAIQEKENLDKFTSIFTDFVKIVVFVMIGMLIKIPLNKVFFLKSIVLFLIYLAIRYFSVSTAFKKAKLSIKDKLFMTMSVSKGIAVGVVVLILASLNIPGLKPFLEVSLLFILYSVIISTLTIRFMKFFVKKDVAVEKIEKAGKKKCGDLKE